MRQEQLENLRRAQGRSFRRTLAFVAFAGTAWLAFVCFLGWAVYRVVVHVTGAP